MAASPTIRAPALPRGSRRQPDLLTIRCAGRQLRYQGRPLVMGILNVTPDSFSDGGRFLDAGEAIEHGLRLVEEGADVLDVGGESTRPGARGVSREAEARRVLPVIAGLAKRVRVPISVDTSKAAVAAQAMDAGASIINDVTALGGDPQMAAVAARRGAAVILMHMQGTPRTMQRRPRYRDVVAEVVRSLGDRVRVAEDAGVERARLLIDPGLGFGKTVAHNLTLMQRLRDVVAVGLPVVIGPSRKSFIGAMLEAEVQDRLAGTLACVAQAQRCGVHLVRVHDVQPAVQLLRMVAAMEHDAAWREH